MASATRFQRFHTLLNGPLWHERALWLYGVIVLAHWAEHLAQAWFEVEVISGIWMQGLILVLSILTLGAALWLVKEGFTIWRRHVP